MVCDGTAVSGVKKLIIADFLHYPELIHVVLRQWQWQPTDRNQRSLPKYNDFQVPQPVRILLILHIEGANYYQACSNPNLRHYNRLNSSSLLL